MTLTTSCSNASRKYVRLGLFARLSLVGHTLFEHGLARTARILEVRGVPTDGLEGEGCDAKAGFEEQRL